VRRTDLRKDTFVDGVHSKRALAMTARYNHLQYA